MDNTHHHRQHLNLLADCGNGDDQKGLSHKASNQGRTVKSKPFNSDVLPNFSTQTTGDASAFRHLAVVGLSTVIMVGIFVLILKMSKEMVSDLKDMGV